VVKGEISGSEDLYVDGEVRGSIELRDHALTVGPNGKVEANVTAREIVIHGTLNGNVQAADKIEIRKTGSILGDLTTARIIIEDGAYFKGSIDILKPGHKAEPHHRPAPASAKSSTQPTLQMAAAAESGKS
jgi:cytoskeletal protein CcmA (bactofilin family)